MTAGTTSGSPLLSWLERPRSDRGVHFAAAGDDWDFRSYAELADRTRAILAGLRASGVGPGDVVSVVEPAGPDFVATLFAAMAAGAAPSPIAPPLTFGDRDVYREHVLGLLRAAAPRVLVCADRLTATIGPLAATAGVSRVLTAEELVAAGGDARGAVVEPGPLALLQFTSGSSGRARGVRVPHAALAANVAAIRRWLAMTPDDPTASWLPVHHDMGLIGCLVTPVVNTSDLWLMPSEEFVRDPARYLRCFGRHGARLTSMPNFGLEYVARRVRPAALDGMDFSAWRAVIVGAERIDVDALRRFCDLLEPHGFDPRALLPAYGLAEATLAVTGLPLDELYTAVDLRPDRLRPGARVVAGPDEPGGDGPTQPVVGCGRPLAGVQVRILDGDGAPVPDGVVGEIEVRGPAVAQGYLTDGESASQTALADGVLRTADAGFLHEGQLHVLGRLGDSMKVRGRTVFAEDLEWAVCRPGVPAQRMAALLGHRAGAATVVAVFEQARPEWLAQASQELRRRAEGAQVVIVDAPRGTIARTSSGKPRRRQMWQAFVDDRLPGTVVTPTAGQRQQTTEHTTAS
ncbi:AMP-binding protein [Micromonospora sp. WMMD980]|uniref:AMP-binding protein n=1 Tax=Micromonospora sp. WMMD980 TaxID=3016088 RepID=UPI002415A4A2|nr:AMP-binding protein [Micromonospora sp. WMMD980]MDG4800833.1 AMP-binding protein [Micromonospora sp. WMMD980]